MPNISVWMMLEKTNIHAKENTKTAEPMPEFIHVATSGAEPAKDVDKVVRAGWLKIW